MIVGAQAQAAAETSKAAAKAEAQRDSQERLLRNIDAALKVMAEKAVRDARELSPITGGMNSSEY
jgi:uncharacterized protein YpiB (UPF0302 family)